MGYEPTVNLFRHYFYVNNTNERLHCKTQNNGVKLFMNPSGKVTSWSEKVFLIESMLGWGFKHSEVAFKVPEEPSGLDEYEKAAKRAIEEPLGFLGKSSQRLYDWKKIINNEMYLRSAGISGKLMDQATPVCYMAEVSLFLCWLVYIGRVFGDDCKICKGAFEKGCDLDAGLYLVLYLSCFEIISYALSIFLFLI